MTKAPGLCAIVLIVAQANHACAGDVPSHDDEISAFASTMAIAKTVKASCPDLEVDDQFFESLRQRLHVADADRLAFVPRTRAASDALERARDEAPNRQAWCDAVFRLYGPDGRLRGCWIREGFLRAHLLEGCLAPVGAGITSLSS